MKTIALGLITAALLSGQTSTWRPVYLGLDGMVATAHYLTAMAGYGMLRDGGNAVDAAAAACFASTVVEPSRSGIGGDAFILIYRAKTREVLFINGGGWAPNRATVKFYQEKGGLDLDGPLSPVVPGAPAALLLAQEKYGKLKRERVLAPAIELAERGFVVSENLQNVFRLNVERLQKFRSGPAVWFRNGEPVKMGDVVIRKNLGRTLRRIGERGKEGFYKGPVAENIVDFLGRSGGIMETSDLAEFAAEEAQPLHVRYRGYDVYGVGLPTQSPVMLEALKILEGFDLKGMGHNSADYIHHVVEALKLAFADRDAYIGDPRFVKDVPIDRLLSDEYAARRRALIRKDRAIDGVAPPGLQSGVTALYAREAGSHVELTGRAAFPDWIENFTTHISAVDKERNMVTITSSVASNFGSAMYVDGEWGGFFINDVLARFRLDATHPNGLAPRKRPRQTLNPVLVLKDGKPCMVFGSPGGDTQGQSQLQFFLNYVEFGMNVQQALEQPYFSTGAYHQSFHPHRPGKGLSVSQRISRDVRDELAKRGHPVRTHSAMGVGSVKAIVVDDESKVLMGGAAPATDSYVIGW
ncbi:MAG: gamma-glutamyltransferase [Bryobacteraceae bacterium]|nr:gamma-glutamyltransferase [Bryobacteraceae bacterium]